MSARLSDPTTRMPEAMKTLPPRLPLQYLAELLIQSLVLAFIVATKVLKGNAVEGRLLDLYKDFSTFHDPRDQSAMPMSQCPTKA